jgi:hypothetical protein
MSTPNDERPEPTYHQPSYHLPAYNVNPETGHPHHGERSSDEEGTVVGDHRDPSNHSHHSDLRDHQYHDEERDGPIDPRVHRMGSHLTVDTANDPHYHPRLQDMTSPSQSREMANRLDDDLELLKIERQVSREAETKTNDGASHIGRQSSRRDDLIDEFDVATNPIHEQAAMYKPPQDPVGKFSKLVKKIHSSSFLIRYLTYILPLVLILLIPLLIGAFVSPATSAVVGGVELMWFMIWLEIVWLTLWAGRVSSVDCIYVFAFSDANSFSRNASPIQLVLFLLFSQTTARNGVIWVSNSSFLRLCSSGGLVLRFHSCRP